MNEKYLRKCSYKLTHTITTFIYINNNKIIFFTEDVQRQTLKALEQKNLSFSSPSNLRDQKGKLSFVK